MNDTEHEWTRPEAEIAAFDGMRISVAFSNTLGPYLAVTSAIMFTA
jgi:hypothetical protein